MCAILNGRCVIVHKGEVIACGSNRTNETRNVHSFVPTPLVKDDGLTMIFLVALSRN